MKYSLPYGNVQLPEEIVEQMAAALRLIIEDQRVGNAEINSVTLTELKEALKAYENA